MPNNFPKLSEELMKALLIADIDSFKAQTLIQMERDYLCYFDYQIFKKYFSSKINKTNSEKLLMALFYKEKNDKNYNRYQHYSLQSLNESANLLNQIYIWFDKSYAAVNDAKDKFSEKIFYDLNNYFEKIQKFIAEECVSIKKVIANLDKTAKKKIKLPEIDKSKFSEKKYFLKNSPLIRLEKLKITHENFVFVPKPIANYLKKPKPWYLFWLPSLNSVWSMMFNQETNHFIGQINVNSRKLANNINILTSEIDWVKTDANFDILFESLYLAFNNNLRLNELVKQAKASKPTWPLSWFTIDANRALNNWFSFLKNSEQQLIDLEIALLEKIILAVEPIFLEKADDLEENSLLFDRIYSINITLDKMFQQIEKSKNLILFERFVKLYKNYKSVVNLSGVFIKKITNKSIFPLIDFPSQGIIVKAVEPEKFKKIFNFYVSNTTGEQSKAIELIGKMISAEEYPSILEFQKAISILIKDTSFFSSKELSDLIIRQYILPGVTGSEHPGYSFVKSYCQSMLNQWLISKRPEAEYASELLRNILIYDAGEELLLAKEAKPILVNGLEISIDIEIVKRAINIIKDLSCEQYDYTIELRQNLQKYLENYNGDNNNYSDLVQCLAHVLNDGNLLLNYARKRILFLLKNQPENFSTDPFIKANYNNPAFQKLIESTIDDFFDSKSQDTFSGDTYLKIKKCLGSNFSLFSKTSFKKQQDNEITLKAVQVIMQCFYNNDFVRGANKIEFLLKNLNRYAENDVSYLNTKKILEATMRELLLWMKTLIFQDLNKVNRIKAYIVEPFLKKIVIDNIFFTDLVWFSNNYSQLYKIYSELFVTLNNIISGFPTEIIFNTDYFSILKKGLPEEKINEIQFLLKKAKSNLPQIHPANTMLNRLFYYLSSENNDSNLQNNLSVENFNFSLKKQDYVLTKKTALASDKADNVIKNLDELIGDMDTFFSSKSRLRDKGKQKVYVDEYPRNEIGCC